VRNLFRFACLLALVGVIGCGKKDDTSVTPTGAPAPPGPSGPSAGPGSSAPSGATQSPGDLAVLKVKNALVTNKEKLGIQNMSVTHSAGTITLRGSVKSEHLKNLAGQIAAPVAAGMKVDNQINVAQ